MTLRLDCVSRDFAGVHAVTDVTLEVERGEVVGLVGPNGSGKTTLVNLASGVVAPSGGRVSVDGVDLSGAGPDRFARAGLVRTFQSLRLFEGMIVLDNVRMGAQRGVRASLAQALLRPPSFRRRERSLTECAMVALDHVGLGDLAYRPVTALSHGQRRRVELARAFAARPRYLILDEPGAGVQPDQLAALADLIAGERNRGAGVLVVEHDTGMVDRLCDRVLGMADGRVVAEGTFSQVAGHPLLAPHLRAPT
jgi:ABC-type branched-subunit amino acid transport system ATPase component